MPGGSKKGGGLETKKSTFYLKSGNSPLFKQVGSSPLKQMSRKCTSLGCTGVSEPAGGKKGSFKGKKGKGLGIGKIFKGVLSDVSYAIKKRKRKRQKRKKTGSLDPFTRTYTVKNN